MGLGERSRTSTLTIPGMIDPHVHLRDLDWAHKGTFASETAAVSRP